MKARISKQLQNEGILSFCSSILAIICGLLIGLIILLISNPSQALPGFLEILKGSFTNGVRGVDTMLYMAVPIIMTGLSVGFAFKTGLFNIGVTGQLTVGAFAAIFVGVKATFLPSSIHWLIAVIAAMLAGAIWGLVPGLLKAHLNVNEVISSIMMNYIGMYAVNMWVQKYLYDSLKNQSVEVESSALLPKGFFDQIIPDTKMTIAILIAIMFVIIVYIVMNKTAFGYEIKACGKNREATRYAGINAKRNIVLSMVIAGALAGIGGAMIYLAGTGKYWQVLDVLAPEGFQGISVALLGGSNPIGILFSGLFIQHITIGGLNMQLYGFAPEVVDIIIASIIYCGALSLLFKGILKKIAIKLRKEETIE